MKTISSRAIEFAVEKMLPFPWMISETIDLDPGYYNYRNLWRIIPAGNVDPAFHSIFQLNIAHLENRCENGKINETTLYNRTVRLLDYYGF